MEQPEVIEIKLNYKLELMINRHRKCIKSKSPNEVLF